MTDTQTAGRDHTFFFFFVLEQLVQLKKYTSFQAQTSLQIETARKLVYVFTAKSVGLTKDILPPNRFAPLQPG